MSKTVQLQILKEEEKVLRDIEAKLKDQLNRLKVEELTLINQISVNTEGDTPNALKPDPDVATTTFEVINKPDDGSGVTIDQEGELVNIQPLLDLDVNQQFLMIGGEPVEEEEEEEEEADDVTDHDQLTAFMKRLEKDGGS